MIDSLAIGSLSDQEWVAWFRRQCALGEALKSELEAIDVVAATPSVIEFRADMLYQAPRALDALGIKLAWSRWKRAVDELHRNEQWSIGERDARLQLVRLHLAAVDVWLERGRPDDCPTSIDLDEAQLRVGYTEAEAQRVIDGVVRLRAQDDQRADRELQRYLASVGDAA